MKLSKLIMIGLFSAGVLMTAGAAQTNAQQNTNGKCEIKTFAPNIGSPMKDLGGQKKFKKQGNSVYIGVEVTGKNCNEAVTLAAWEAKSLSGMPYREQNLYAHKTRTLKTGTHRLSIELPKDPVCFYQIDLVRGNNPRGINDGGAYQKGRMIHSVHGGRKDCVTKPEVEKIKVCELATKNVITIDEKDFDATLHTKDLSLCGETPTVPEEPETPTEEKGGATPDTLPETGVGSTLASLFGASSLAASAYYYVQSRRLM